MLANTIMEHITNLPVIVINEYNQCIIASYVEIQETTEWLQYLPVLRTYIIQVFTLIASCLNCCYIMSLLLTLILIKSFLNVIAN